MAAIVDRDVPTSVMPLVNETIMLYCIALLF